MPTTEYDFTFIFPKPETLYEEEDKRNIDGLKPSSMSQP
jgi:hypothetical protein